MSPSKETQGNSKVEKPPVDEFKLDFNGSSKGNPRHYRIGVIIQNWVGK